MKFTRRFHSFFLLCTLIAPIFAENTDHIYHFDNEWALKIDLTGFNIQKNNYDYDKGLRNIYAFSTDGLVVSVFIEPAVSAGDSKKAREYYTTKLNESPVKRSEIKTYEKGDAAYYEYMVLKYQDQEINQKSINIYFARDNLWVDVHISKVRYAETDKTLLNKFIHGVKIENKTAADYFAAGSYMYLNKKFPDAAKYYSSALTLETQKPSLSEEKWQALIDAFGMSLVISGNPAKAKEIFLIGIKRDPDYPISHYNLACTYAEEGDVANALLYLKSAIAISKKNGIKIPDAKKDSSFKKFKENKEFQELVAN